MAIKKYGDIEYDTKIDYEAGIKQAASVGDYEYAGVLERKRNAKIQGEGLDYYKTSRYQEVSSPFKNTANGVGGSANLNAQGSRSTQINGILSGLNSSRFSYNPKSDPVYKSYKAANEESAKAATRDTMAQAAGMTGGIPSSYAITASQQAGDVYRKQADNIVPELYSLAYGMYADERADKYNQLNMLMGLDNAEFNRGLQLAQHNQGVREYNDSIEYKNRALTYEAEQAKRDSELAKEKQAFDNRLALYKLYGYDEGGNLTLEGRKFSHDSEMDTLNYQLKVQQAQQAAARAARQAEAEKNALNKEAIDGLKDAMANGTDEEYLMEFALLYGNAENLAAYRDMLLENESYYKRLPAGVKEDFLDELSNENGNPMAFIISWSKEGYDVSVLEEMLKESQK